MLETILAKVITTTKNWWKWILVGVMVFVVLLVVWRLKKQKSEIERLKAEKLALEEQAKDLMAKAEKEKNAAVAAALREEANHLQGQVQIRASALAKLEKDYKDEQAQVDKARDWKALRAAALAGKPEEK
jgi:GTP cyclohydrolase II